VERVGPQVSLGPPGQNSGISNTLPASPQPSPPIGPSASHPTITTAPAAPHTPSRREVPAGIWLAVHKQLTVRVEAPRNAKHSIPSHKYTGCINQNSAELSDTSSVCSCFIQTVSARRIFSQMMPTLCKSGSCCFAGSQVLAALTCVTSPVETTEPEKHCGVPRAVQSMAQRGRFVFGGRRASHISLLVPLTRAEKAEQNHFMQAAYEIAHQLNNGGGGGSDDEGGEEEDFGLGAIDPARMHPDGGPIVGVLAFEIECSQRAARRASSNNAASFVMTEHSWSANDRTAARFLRFLVLVYGQHGNGAEPPEEQATRLASVLTEALPFRLRRFFLYCGRGGVRSWSAARAPRCQWLRLKTWPRHSDTCTRRVPAISLAGCPTCPAAASARKFTRPSRFCSGRTCKSRRGRPTKATL